MRLCRLPSLTEDDLEHFNYLVQDLEVDLNCVDSLGFSPLLLLCRNNQSNKLVQLVTAFLLRNSVDLDYQNARGWNALISVCFYYTNPHIYEVVALLLKNDVNTDAVTKKGWSAIFALCRRTHKAEPYFFDVFQLLINKIDVATKTSAGSNVLVALTYCNYQHPNYLEMARQLIKKGADPNATDFKGRNSFLILCEKNKSVDLLLMLRELIILGVNPSTKENNDRNASEILKSNRPELLSEEAYRSLFPV